MSEKSFILKISRSISPLTSQPLLKKKTKKTKEQQYQLITVSWFCGNTVTPHGHAVIDLYVCVCLCIQYIFCEFCVFTLLSVYLLLLTLASSTHSLQSPILYHWSVQPRPEEATTTCRFTTQNELGRRKVQEVTQERRTGKRE